MNSVGSVVGGAYLNASVTTTTFGSDLVIQNGFKRHKLNAETVGAWEEIVVEARNDAISAIGKAATGVALPGRLGRAASAAVGAALDSRKPPHQVRVDWANGKQSLLKLPDDLFTHFALTLASIRIETAAPLSTAAAAGPEVPQTATDRAFDLVTGIIRDRWPVKSKTDEALPLEAPRTDVAEQLTKLSALRDAGILTEEEFTSKKTELLGRL